MPGTQQRLGKDFSMSLGKLTQWQGLKVACISGLPGLYMSLLTVTPAWLLPNLICPRENGCLDLKPGLAPVCPLQVAAAAMNTETFYSFLPLAPISNPLSNPMFSIFRLRLPPSHWRPPPGASLRACSQDSCSTLLPEPLLSISN